MQKKKDQKFTAPDLLQSLYLTHTKITFQRLYINKQSIARV